MSKVATWTTEDRMATTFEGRSMLRSGKWTIIYIVFIILQRTDRDCWRAMETTTLALMIVTIELLSIWYNPGSIEPTKINLNFKIYHHSEVMEVSLLLEYILEL